MDPMKKILAAIAILILSGLLVAGCQPITNSSTSAASEIPATTAPPVPTTALPATEQVLPTATSEPTAAAPGTGVTSSLEGQAWQLVSYSDAAEAQKTPVANTSVTATFAKGQVTGNAGCNNYFASYQLNGDKLTISTIGSTMMACLTPGVMVQETAYLQALQKAASFQINAGQLEISDAQGKTNLVYNPLSQAASLPAQTPVPGQTQLPEQLQPGPASLSLESLKNMDYRSGFTVSGRAPLKDGEYREAGPQGSASETVVKLVEQVAYGELPDGQVAAAVALATDTGGSGTFYDLMLVTDLNGAPLNIASVFLGDRIKLNSLKIENGQVLVDMVKQGPNDPMCCPTLHVLQKYALQGSQLVLVSTEEIK